MSRYLLTAGGRSAGDAMSLAGAYCMAREHARQWPGVLVEVDFDGRRQLTYQLVSGGRARVWVR